MEKDKEREREREKERERERERERGGEKRTSEKKEESCLRVKKGLRDHPASNVRACVYFITCACTEWNMLVCVYARRGWRRKPTPLTGFCV
jgi:hypothetical protein